MEKIASPWFRNAYLRYPHFGLIERFMGRVQGLGPVLILLLGLGARGEFTQHSDANVLLVVAEPVDWVRGQACSEGRVEPVVKGKDELVGGLRSGEPFWCETIEGGLASYQRGDTCDQLRAVVR